jgi:RNA polymerase sigma-70 factor (ECF subfamily)
MDCGTETTLALLARARAGDRMALEAIAARLLPRMRRWAAGRLPSWARDLADTEDLVQETISSVLRRVDRFEVRHEAALTIYLREALSNRLRNEIRRAVRHPPAGGIDAVAERPSPAPSPLDLAITQEALEHYESALATLVPEDREAIIGRMELHYSFDELAQAWGKPSADAARKVVKRALNRLADAMGNAA